MESRIDVNKEVVDSDNQVETLFASSGSIGVVDLGASQTVIGSNQVNDLLANLPSSVRSQIRRITCNLIFRFGNQQTLTSKHALLLPLGSTHFRIAVVPGNTPFLLSSSFLKGIQAVIDTGNGSMWNKTLGKYLPIEINQKNLYLLDINHLWTKKDPESQIQEAGIASSACPIVDVAKSESQAARDQSNQTPKFVRTEDQSSPTCHETQHHPTSGPRHPNESAASESDSHREDQHVGGSEAQGIPQVWQGSKRGGRAGENQSNDTGRAGERSDRVWHSKAVDAIPESFRGSSMDGLVCGHIRDLRQDHPQEIREVRREEAGERAIGREESEGVPTTNPRAPTEEVNSSIQWRRRDMGYDLASGVGGRSPGSPTSPTRRDELHQDRECSTAWPIGQHGDGDSGACPAHQGHESEGGRLDGRENLPKDD